MEAAPISFNRSSILWPNARATASSARTASAVTSGPIPSPGNTATVKSIGSHPAERIRSLMVRTLGVEESPRVRLFDLSDGEKRGGLDYALGDPTPRRCAT